MKIKIIFCAFLIIIAMNFAARAQSDVGIAAIVNDSAISTIDIKERLKIAMFGANLPSGQGFEEKLVQQILRNLIDEKLYAKEAERFNITISEADINRVVADIEKRNGIQPGKFKEYLRSNGLSHDSMMAQVRSQLTWNKIIAKRIRSQIAISDKEIDEKIENIAKKSGIEEFNISEILLTVDNPADDKKTTDIANKLVKELRQEGNFSTIAKEFSKASSAEKNGELGWVQAGQFPDELASVIRNMGTGEISSPIKTLEGYYILKVNDRRAIINSNPDESEVGLRKAFVAIKEGSKESEIKKLRKTIEKKREDLKSCAQFDEFAKDIGSSSSPQMVMAQISKLPPEISGNIRNLEVGQASEIITNGGGLNVFMVCEKTEAAPALALRNKIKEGLMARKTEMQANRYLRDLRRSAFIEVRIQ